MNYDGILEKILIAEGGYSNHPDDKGGETNFGITLAVARANGYMGPMRNMPIEFAKAVYKKRYIQEPRFDAVGALDEGIALELIDTGINMGPHRSTEFLQRLLNGFNSERKWDELFVDGRLGEQTLNALEKFLYWRGSDGRVALLKGLNGLQLVRYLDITEKDPTQRKFLFGWVKNRIE